VLSAKLPAEKVFHPPENDEREQSAAENTEQSAPPNTTEQRSITFQQTGLTIPFKGPFHRHANTRKSHKSRMTSEIWSETSELKWNFEDKRNEGEQWWWAHLGEVTQVPIDRFDLREQEGIKVKKSKVETPRYHFAKP